MYINYIYNIISEKLLCLAHAFCWLFRIRHSLFNTLSSLPLHTRCGIILHGHHCFLSPRARFSIMMPSYQYRKFHCGDKTILRPSYLHNGISYTGKTTSLYWIRALNALREPHDVFRVAELVTTSIMWCHDDIWHRKACQITGSLSRKPRPLFTKKTPSYQYRDSHYKPETVVRPS